MRNLILSFMTGISLAFGANAALAASPEQEQAFLDTYKAAFEAKDGDALRALLFSDGAIPMAVEFYAEMMTADFGKQISSIALEELDAEDLARIDEVMPTPDGGSARLAPKPYKKLVIKIDTSDTSGTSSTTSSTFVAEQDGRLGVSMPVPAN